TGQKRADGGFSAPGGPYQGHRFSGFDLKRDVGQHRGIIIAVMKRDMVIADGSLYLFQRPGIRRVLDLRSCFDNRYETFKAGKSLLHHLCQFHQDLYGADEDADIEGIHGQIRRLHKTGGDEISAIHQGDQIHQTLEKGVAALEISHAPVIIILGQKKGMDAFLKFMAFHVFVGKGLDDTDAGQRVLETGVDIADFFAVFHERFLHPPVLPYGKEDHAEHQQSQYDGKTPVDQEQKDEGTDDFHQGDKQVLRPVMGEFRNVKQVGDQL